jgi:hypothetical protein
MVERQSQHSALEKLSRRSAAEPIARERVFTHVDSQRGE